MGWSTVASEKGGGKEGKEVGNGKLGKLEGQDQMFV